MVLDDKILVISCVECGNGEVIGEDGYVYPSHAKKKGCARCQTCNGLGWVVERIALKTS